MKYQVTTLIDITETRARFDKNDVDWHRQQNYMTVLQTIGLRANPIVEKSPVSKKMSVKNLGFGSKFKGQHQVWQFEFDLDFATIEQCILEEDFDLVPVISGLSETVKLDKSAFITRDAETVNLIFKCVD